MNKITAVLAVFALLAGSVCFAAPIESLTQEFNGSAGQWVSWNAATVDLTARPGWVRLTVPAGAYAGLISTAVGPTGANGPNVVDFPPPWHVEICFDRPNGVNSAIGMILQSDGIQHLFNRVIGYTPEYFGWTTNWDASGKGTPYPNHAPWPTSAPEEAAQSGDPFYLYFGVVDNTHIRYGIKANEADQWTYLTDDAGFSLSAVPVSFSYMTIMIETRDGHFAQFGGAPGPGQTVVDIDYIRYFTGLTGTVVPVELSTFTIE